MTKKTVCCLLGSLLIFSCAQVKKVQVPQTLPTAIPALRILNDTTATAIHISKLSIDISVCANIATTTFDITFLNPNDRILEGEFEFPLADGQHIVRYALDIDGKLREGVVVEKAKARVAFENTIRRQIDPGLVEKTKGNNFRTRIYPLPAKGSRHIVIAIEQPLAQFNRSLLYQLPLYSTSPIEQFSINAAVVKSKERPVTTENGIADFHFDQKDPGWKAAWSRKNYTANQTLAFQIPFTAENETSTVTENFNGETFFYVHSRIADEMRKKKMPGSIGVFWDISASGEKRDLEKEKKLLHEYIAAAGNVKVTLIPFDIMAQEREDFVIQNGDDEQLLKRINAFRYDGGTQFGALNLGKYDFDEILLFSDGLSTFGKKEIALANIPVVTISSSASADHSYLKYIAQQTHGKFVDLTIQDIAAATDELMNHSLQVIKIESDPSAIEDLAIPFAPIRSSGLSFAGKLRSASATIKIVLGYGDEPVTTKVFTIDKPSTSECDQVKRIWAIAKISELDLQYEKNKELITKIGKAFSVVTQNTSLIVLDRVEDYVEHEITPPAELQQQYITLLKEKKEMEKNEKSWAVDAANEAMSELKAWWSKDHRKRKDNTNTSEPPVPVELSVQEIGVANQNGSATTTDSVRISAGVGTLNYASPPTSVDIQYDQLSDAKSETQLYYMTTTTSKGEDSEASVSTIQLKEWKSDMPYLKAMENAEAGKRETIYFELKKQFADQPSFFIDVARFFIAKQDAKTGLRVLSNVAEMKLENAELLRTMANQLLEMSEKALAVETFRELVKMREEDPQSYRDLALALNETGQFNEAVQLLHKVATHAWETRSGEIHMVALNEMNAIISAHKSEVNVSGIDPKLIQAMPVDVRIVITWSSDNSDIDLWVTDPNREKCSYEHTETRIGGRISRDVTQGFGPEEFSVKKAINGQYKVEVNLYGDTRQTAGGPIAIKAELFTDFGKPTQKREIINFRVTTNKDVVEVGSLKFGS
jgi:tetratricopeptide (TPR) repeat protein